MKGTEVKREGHVSRAEKSKEIQRIRACDGEEPEMSGKKARRRRERMAKAAGNIGAASAASAVSRRKVDSERARELAGKRLSRWREGGLIVRCFVYV